MIKQIENTLKNSVLRLWSSVDANAQISARRRIIDRLEKTSDADLARLGIERDRIAQYAFRDLYYV
ncbi:MAG: hypothetical protein AAGA97_01610 [Pseudomonadota bacterium]